MQNKPSFKNVCLKQNLYLNNLTKLHLNKNQEFNVSIIHLFFHVYRIADSLSVFYILRELVRVSFASRALWFSGDDFGTTWCNAMHLHRCEHTEKFRVTMKHSQHPSQHSTVCRVIHGDCSYLISRARASYKSIRGTSRSCLAVVLRHTWANRMQHRKATSWYDTMHQGRSLRGATITVSPYFQNQKFARAILSERIQELEAY